MVFDTKKNTKAKLALQSLKQIKSTTMYMHEFKLHCHFNQLVLEVNCMIYLSLQYTTFVIHAPKEPNPSLTSCECA